MARLENGSVNPFAQLALMGRDVWNNWVQAALTDAQIAEYRELFACDAEVASARLEEKFGSSLPNPMEIRLHGCFFQLDMDFSGFIFPAGEVSIGNPTFSGSHFESNVSFADAKFLGCPDFSDCVFSGDCDFASASFFKGALFKRANFKRAIFERAQFLGPFPEGGSNFRDAKFHTAAFAQARFAHRVVFSRIEVSGVANFMECDFEEVSFEDAKFAKDALFSRAKFLKTTWFN